MKRSAILTGIFCTMLGGATTAVTLLGPGDMKWEHEKGDAPGSDSMTLREDAKSGDTELMAHYPAGHKFKSHWHSVDERIVLLEGKLHIEASGIARDLEPGGYAFLPAKEVQKMECVSKVRCGFYVHWNGKLDFHPASEIN
jgi:quercetin dioxygenase-like cupin family protein